MTSIPNYRINTLTAAEREELNSALEQLTTIPHAKFDSDDELFAWFRTNLKRLVKPETWLHLQQNVMFCSGRETPN